MPDRAESESRKLLGRLRAALAETSAGQDRLNRVVGLIASSMGTEVCSVYLFRDAETLELCATVGLKAESVHKTRMRLGEGLVGRTARTRQVMNTANAPQERGFRYMPETGEEVYSSFCGIPIQRLGEALGVLVVQSKAAREFSADEVYALEVVAMVLAEMTELGAFLGGDGGAPSARHQRAVMFRGGSGQEGAAAGRVYLHEPRVVISNPISDDPDRELARLREAIDTLRAAVDQMMATATSVDPDQVQVFEAYRMFANSKSWLRRMEEDIGSGLSAEAAVEKEQSLARSRMQQAADPYLRERLHDLDDLSNRLLRILTGQGADTGAEMPENPVLVARNIGPGELLEYGKTLKGIVLEEGSVGSHAAIVARAWAIPLVIHATGITTEALNGDTILVDGDQGIVHLRPEETVRKAFGDKIAMQARAMERYAGLRDLPAEALCGTGWPSHECGVDGRPAVAGRVWRGRRRAVPDRVAVPCPQQDAPAGGVVGAVFPRDGFSRGKRVAFRTLDIGSDKVLSYMKPNDEPNPAMGWRAIRVGLDKPGVLRMQLQALIRAANGRPLTVMFPLIAQPDEYRAAKAEFDKALDRERILGHPLPERTEVGVMLETPSLAFAPDAFWREVDFVSVGGNDLKQFFFAADRENERVRRRYDTLDVSFLGFLELIVARCRAAGTTLSFCGEDAGRPVEAVVFAALGFRMLSMRPASVGPVKHLLRRVDLTVAKAVIDAARARGEQSVRSAVMEWLASVG